MLHNAQPAAWINTAARLRNPLVLAGLALAALACWSGPAHSQESSVTKLTADAFLFQYGFHSNVFVVTRDGVIVTDPISPKAAAACLDAIRDVTDQPVRYVIYSHDHSDHIAGGGVFKRAQFVAHEAAWRPIKTRNNPEIVAPDLLVGDSLTIRLGGKTVDLMHLGRLESPSNLAILFREDKVLMWVDVVRSFGVPYRYLEGTDLADLRRAFAVVAEWDFEHLVPGHGKATGKARLSEYARYFDDLERYATEEMGKYTQLQHRAASDKVNPERFFDSYISLIAVRVLDRMRKEYGELGGFSDWGPKNAERMVVYLLHELPFDYR